MLVACRLAGLSALEAHYADVVAPTQSGAGERVYWLENRLRGSHSWGREALACLGANAAEGGDAARDSRHLPYRRAALTFR
jgi:hypothetical protein